MHLFALALLWLDDSFTIDQDIADAKALNDRIALSHPLEKLPQEAPADLILSAMQAVVEHFDLPEHYHTLLENVKAQIEHPELTIGGRLVTEIDHLSLETFGQEKGQAYHDYAWHAHYAPKGYENMELSTQLLLFDAIQKGVTLIFLMKMTSFSNFGMVTMLNTSKMQYDCQR